MATIRKNYNNISRAREPTQFYFGGIAGYVKMLRIEFYENLKQTSIISCICEPKQTAVEFKEEKSFVRENSYKNDINAIIIIHFSGNHRKFYNNIRLSTEKTY